MSEKETHLRKATFRNDIQDVPALGTFIDGIAEEEHIDPAICGSVNLALEEAVVNVMNYAYPKGAEGVITLESNIDSRAWTFKLMDRGVSFDPTKAADADISLGVEERPVGGLGIFLVRQIMDSIVYERKDGWNILTMTKDITT